MQLKYIVHTKLGYRSPVIFDANIDHVDIAEQLDVVDHIDNAGFLQITIRGVNCYGESMTLRRQADKIADRALILRMGGDNLD